MTTVPLYDLSPLLRMLLLGVAIAAGPLAWWWLRHRRAEPVSALHALTVLTLFITFDLVIFGAFTRLSDSGLGCPDWPGCYGSASPLGARDEIHAAQTAMPSGPVTHGKAWVEMVHRYLATGVGVLITVLTLASWWLRRRLPNDARVSPGWAGFTLLWVCLQGAFGALTVTMKLYPAVVTLHLLGGLTLLALLAAQAQGLKPHALALPAGLRLGLAGLLGLAVIQVALGGWVSTNYAVLACRDFPACQGSWWPAMDFEQGFTLNRALGAGSDGGYLPFAALTAIHMVHRLGAAVVLSVMLLIAWKLHRVGGTARSGGLALVALAAWQAISGISNVVLGWPLAAALAHTAGAAALIVLLVTLLVRARQAVEMTPARTAPATQEAHGARPRSAAATS